MLDHECSPECEAHPAMRALHDPLHDPSNIELLAWVRGFIAGHDAGFYDGRAAGHDEHHSRCEPFYEQLVHQAGRVSTRAGRAKAWRDAVNRGLCP